MKRIIDLLISTFVLFILGPFILICGIMILLLNGPPILFKQKRAGLKGRIFTLYKFRTMNQSLAVNGDAHGKRRITNLGKILRKMSIDELPSLLNVLLGDMSIVGPRPLLPEYLHLYSDEQKRRHDIKPGITGWAQINGRNIISWDRKFKLDIWYVENRSLVLDFKIIFMTIWNVILQHDIDNSEEETMDPFRG